MVRLRGHTTSSLRQEGTQTVNGELFTTDKIVGPTLLKISFRTLHLKYLMVALVWQLCLLECTVNRQQTANTKINNFSGYSTAH